MSAVVPLRVSRDRESALDNQIRLWHVTVTVSGEPSDPTTTRDALGRLLVERPFIHSVRYDDRRAELRYWEESPDMVDAASLALRLWQEHRATAGLPNWEVVGLEVVDQETHSGRGLAAPTDVASVEPERF